MSAIGCKADALHIQQIHRFWTGEIVFQHACRLGCESIVSKRFGSAYGSGRSSHWLNIKNPAVRREAEEDWRRS